MTYDRPSFLHILWHLQSDDRVISSLCYWTFSLVCEENTLFSRAKRDCVNLLTEYISSTGLEHDYRLEAAEWRLYGNYTGEKAISISFRNSCMIVLPTSLWGLMGNRPDGSTVQVRPKHMEHPSTDVVCTLYALHIIDIALPAYSKFSDSCLFLIRIYASLNSSPSSHADSLLSN